MNEIPKQCPFCGARATIEQQSEYDWIVECPFGCVRNEGFESREDLMRFWNDRYIEQVQP